MNDIERFMEKFEKTEGCWNWTATQNGDGYGSFWFRNRLERAHRISYTFFVGEIPQGKFVLHRCDNRACVNPAHLYIGTNKDNMIDMVSRGRSPYAILTENDVLAIRREYSEARTNKQKLAKRYGVHVRTIRGVLMRETWKHI